MSKMYLYCIKCLGIMHNIDIMHVTDLSLFNKIYIEKIEMCNISKELIF